MAQRERLDISLRGPDRQWRIEEQPMQQLQGQYLVDCRGVVAVSFQVAPYNSLEGCALEIWPRKGARIEQHFTNVRRQGIAVPDAEMAELVPAEEDAFEAERREEMIDLCQPL